ncbi:MAG: hypothetical protein E2O58_08805 [Gammaproteobacteria bacterium]|nr:MAG: hypothetical protein E2O58_08805 [Gammaproteobacteria bacterium]
MTEIEQMLEALESYHSEGVVYEFPGSVRVGLRESKAGVALSLSYGPVATVMRPTGVPGVSSL